MENKTMKELYRELHPYLAHYGVLGMKWGVRRFQPYSLIPRKSGEKGKEIGAAKKSKSKKVSDIKKSIKKTKVSEFKKSRSQKSREAKKEYEQKAKTAKQREAELNKAIKSGDAKSIYEHKSEMSTQQLKSAIDRLNTEAQLRSLVSDQNPSTLKKIKNLADKTNDINSIARSGIATYKTVSDIKNLAKKASQAKSDEEKALASAKAVAELINRDGGIDPSEVVRLRSKITNKDLDDLTKRMKNEDQQNKMKRKEDERQENYLKKTLKEIDTAKNGDDKKSGLNFDKKIDNELAEIEKKYSNASSSSNVDDFDTYVDQKTVTRLKDVNKKQRKNRK